MTKLIYLIYDYPTESLVLVLTAAVIGMVIYV